MAYATGKYAIAQCDRCAFEYPLNQLKKEWNGLKTCPECYESKHPQLNPVKKIADPQALREPRPDTSVSPTSFTVYTNYDLGIIGQKLTIPDSMTSALGTVTITTS